MATAGNNAFLQFVSSQENNNFVDVRGSGTEANIYSGYHDEDVSIEAFGNASILFKTGPVIPGPETRMEITKDGDIICSNVTVSNINCNNLTASGFSNTITTTISMNPPQFITSGYGYIWVSSGTNDDVKLIDPSTKTVAHTITTVGTAISGITSGYGYIWVIGSVTTIKVINPSTRLIVSTISGTGLRSITAGYGYIWATMSGVQVINPITMAVVSTITVGGATVDITAGYGYIWATISAGVSVIDPSTLAVVSTITVGSGPTYITAGYGYIWVNNQTSGTVSVIDPSTLTVVSTITVGSNPFGITAGYGYIWVTNQGIGTTIQVIDPSTLAVVDTITVGSNPRGIIAGYGYIWVARPSGTVSVIQGQGIVTSSDVTTGTLEVENKTTMNGDLELVNSSLSLTGPGTITANTIYSSNVVISGNITGSGIITCNTKVISPSFSQPSQILGTMASPSSSSSQSYTSGINKYIYYYNAYTDVDFLLYNLPVNFLANTTVNTSANWTLTGNAPSGTYLPVFTASTTSMNNTVTTSSEIYVKVMYTTPPTIVSGTGGFKLVITLTQDS